MKVGVMMELIELDSKQYKVEVNAHYIFDSMEFNKLNDYKVERVRYFIFKNNRKRFAVCFGEKDKELYCPFSAPFGNFEMLREPLEIEYLEDAIEMLENYVVEHGYKKIHFILPPLFYDTSFLTAVINILIRKKFVIRHQDINFQFDLFKIVNDYEKHLTRNGKKNLRIALDSNLTVEKCETTETKEQAYNVIAINREQRGYPLRMSFAQVKDTMEIVENDCFIVKKDHEEVAAAVIFRVTTDIVQVVYWGDIQGYSELKPINFLANYLIHYYKERGFKYLDVGPSTEDGVPNIGLCNFKTSIGCDMSPKFSFYKEYEED